MHHLNAHTHHIIQKLNKGFVICIFLSVTWTENSTNSQCKQSIKFTLGEVRESTCNVQGKNEHFTFTKL